ncbi:MAG TPA: PQQ-dependent sugar dehydrogenase, partial [Fimbriimonadaceae bacterium]|nr:PQQ-dependent sugar dehydrogenase [Fimbriimonadaceae bacterium]
DWVVFDRGAPRYRPRRMRMVLALVGVFFGGCSGAGEALDTGGQGPLPTVPSGYRVEVVATGLQVPWGIAFTSPTRMLVTERLGRIRVIEGGVLQPQPIHVVDDVNTGSESGLMAIALHPNYSQNKYVYIAYAYGSGSESVRVRRLTDGGTSLTDPVTIIEGIPSAMNHAGCRLRFGPDGKLYITTGDAMNRQIAQQLGSLGGKTLRINDDGSIPQDNPFVGEQGARGEIWSLGHRNAQGIDFQPGTGIMIQTEHGPSGFDGPGGGDEINLVEKGKNYGWPTVHHDQSQAGMVSPLKQYTPAVAPASGAFYNGDLMPGIKGSYFFGTLRGEALRRVIIENGQITLDQVFASGVGRIREVAQGPDGALYFTSSNRDGRGQARTGDDRIFRVVPAP